MLNLKRKVKFICCMTLAFVCILSIKVQATEDNDIFSSASAKVYTAMSDDSDVVANLIVGNMFEVLDAANDSDGVVWYQVRTDFGAEGYVKANELDRVLMETQQMQQQAQNQELIQNEDTEGNAEAPENAGGEGDAEVPENENEDNEDLEPNDEEGNGEPIGELVVLETVNLRRMPSTGSEIMGRINRNTQLSYYEQYTNEAGEIWYRVEYNNMTGYVTERVVMLTQQEAQPNEEEQLPSEEVVEQSAPAEETTQADETVPNDQQLETETTTDVSQDEFEVVENTDTQKTHRRRGIDWIIVILFLGGALCIAAIFILLKKILRLLR